MKAKEYAVLYQEKSKEKGCNQALSDIAMMFLTEVKTIGESRVPSGHVSESVLRSILNEQSAKWGSFARIAGDGIRANGFKAYVKAKMPYMPIE